MYFSCGYQVFSIQVPMLEDERKTPLPISGKKSLVSSAPRRPLSVARLDFEPSLRALRNRRRGAVATRSGANGDEVEVFHVFFLAAVWASGRASQTCSSMTGFVNAPIRSISMVMVAPGLRKIGGLRAA